MERSRDYLPVRLGTWRKKHFLGFCCAVIAALIISLVVGVLQSQKIPYFKITDVSTTSEFNLEDSKCAVDVYGNPDVKKLCFSHYFEVKNIFTQYFAVDAFFTLKPAYKKDGLRLPLDLSLTWLGRNVETGTCKAAGCSACVQKNDASPSKCLSGGASSPCADCSVECYRCIQTSGINCHSDDPAYNAITRTDRIQEACYASEESDSFSAWGHIAENVTVQRTLRCHSGSEKCNPLTMFKTTHVEYHNYYFEVVLSDIMPEQLQMLDNVAFKIMFQNPLFSEYKLAFKYTFLVVNLLAICLFECKVWKRKRAQNGSHPRARTSGGDSTRPESLRSQVSKVGSTTWVRLLLFALILFNNPVHALEYVSTTRRFFGVLGVLFELIFVGVLFAFWLVELDDLADEDEHLHGSNRSCCPRCTCVCGIKSLLVVSYLLIGAVLYSWIKMTEFADPLYDYHEDRTVWHFVRIFLSVWGLLYVLALSYFVFKAFGRLFCRANSPKWFGTLSPCDGDAARWQRAWVLLYHLFFMLVGISGLAFGRVMQIEADTVFEFLFFSGVFNIYVISLAYMYTPSLVTHADSTSMVSMTRLDDDELEEEIDFTDTVPAGRA
jgi:hypothetical protein